jgi:hypothetical protein
VRLLLSVALLFAPLSHAQTQEPLPPAPFTESQILYQEAIRALAEGRKNDASEGLNRLIVKEPLHAGAWLDLAMIQCELGHAEEAEQLFKVIEQRFAPPAALQEIIARQRQIGCATRHVQKSWNLSLTRGHDQNVNQGASNPYFTLGHGTSQTEVQLSPDFLPRPDHYWQLASDYSQEITQNGALGFVQLATRHHDRFNRYNSISLSTGVEQPWRVAEWSGRATALVGYLSLGGQLYQRQTQLQLRATPPLMLPLHWQLNLSSGITHIRYLTLTNYNGSTLDTRASLGYATAQTQLQASVAYLHDHAHDERPGGNRNGWLTTVQWRNQLGGPFSGEINWSRQTWRAQNNYSPGLIDEKRHQETHILRTTLSYALAAHQSLQLEWRQVWNHENISIFQYRDRQLQINWQWQY